MLGELYHQALQAQGFSVQLNRNIGPTDVTLQALKTGSLRCTPSTSNVFDTTVADDPAPFHSRLGGLPGRASATRSAHGLELLNPTPFSDTDAIAVTVGYAQANHLRSLGDLRRSRRPLTLGGPPQFQQRPTGPADARARLRLHRRRRSRPSPSAPSTGARRRRGPGRRRQHHRRPARHRRLPRCSATRSNVFGWGNVVPVVSAAGPGGRGAGVRGHDQPRQRAADHSGDPPAQRGRRRRRAGPGDGRQQFLETHGLIPPAP